MKQNNNATTGQPSSAAIPSHAQHGGKAPRPSPTRAAPARAAGAGPARTDSALRPMAGPRASRRPMAGRESAAVSGPAARVGGESPPCPRSQWRRPRRAGGAPSGPAAPCPPRDPAVPRAGRHSSASSFPGATSCAPATSRPSVSASRSRPPCPGGAAPARLWYSGVSQGFPFGAG